MAQSVKFAQRKWNRSIMNRGYNLVMEGDMEHMRFISGGLAHTVSRVF